MSGIREARKARSIIAESISEYMELYRTVTKWRDAAKLDVMGRPDQYTQRIKEIGDIVEAMKTAQDAIDRAIKIDEQETINESTDGESRDKQTSNADACA